MFDMKRLLHHQKFEFAAITEANTQDWSRGDAVWKIMQTLCNVLPGGSNDQITSRARYARIAQSQYLSSVMSPARP